MRTRPLFDFNVLTNLKAADFFLENRPTYYYDFDFQVPQHRVSSSKTISVILLRRKLHGL